MGGRYVCRIEPEGQLGGEGALEGEGEGEGITGQGRVRAGDFIL